MAFDLQSLLVRFLQLYREDRADLERVLLLECDGFEEKDPGATAWDSLAADALRERTLIDSETLSREVDRLVSLFPVIPEPGLKSEEFYRQFFRDTGRDLDRVAAAYGSDLRGEEFEKWYIQELRAQEKEDRLQKESEQRDPDFATGFAWEFALNLPKIVSRVQSLGVLDYGDIVSDNLRALFIEAHGCYLGGREISVAIICGAILEQALKETLKEDWKLELMLTEAEERGILTSEEWGTGDTIREIRNEAVHDLPKFMRRSEADKREMLGNTRQLVRKLLAEQMPHTEVKES
jgi:hypothetical protein